MDWIAWHGRALTDHINLANQYTAQGYGFISLSIYGSIASPYYAAVMIRPTPSQQHHHASVPGNQMQQTFNSEAAQGYGPAIIAATGGTSNPMFAAVFEPQNPIALTRWGLPDAPDSRHSYKEYGPFPGWVPVNYSDKRILWHDASNNISLWILDDQGNKVSYKEYGPFPGWVPLNYSDNHILWHDASNNISLWVVDDQGNKVSYKEYGPFAGWVPLNYSDNRILWRDASNKISLWVVDDQGNKVSYKEYGPFPGWVPLNYSDNHILWRDASNKISLWIFDDTIQGLNVWAKRWGLILRWAAAYGDSADPAFLGVWIPNTGGAHWNNDGIAESASDYQARFDAEFSGWCRPAFVTLNASGQYLSLFVDDQIGPWQARHNLTPADYQAAFDSFKQQGYFPVCVQAAGADANSATFAAIFAKSRDVVAKSFSPTGPVTNQQIDKIVHRMMGTYGVRHAALAIVHGTQLVYARGYTLAEPGWPLAQPTTCFRLASVSKVPTALAIFQLVEKNMLNYGGNSGLSAKLQDILHLVTPSGGAPSWKSPSGKGFKDITIQHLLEHTSGLNDDWNSLNVRDAFKAAGHAAASLPVSAAMVNSYIASLDLLTDPGATQAYSNTGYYMLAQVVAKLRNQSRPIDAYQEYLFNPLSITRIRRGVSLVANQPPDEARYQNYDLPVYSSVMSDAQPLVPDVYGNVPLEISEGDGGLSGGATDLARLIAILISQKDSPALTRQTLKSMLSKGAQLTAAGFGRAGYGFDELYESPSNPHGLGVLGSGQFYGQKGGLIASSASVLQFNGPQGWGFTWLWAGNRGDPAVYPDFPEVMSIAQKTDWGSVDLFPEFGMPSL